MAVILMYLLLITQTFQLRLWGSFFIQMKLLLMLKQVL